MDDDIVGNIAINVAVLLREMDEPVARSLLMYFLCDHVLRMSDNPERTPDSDMATDAVAGVVSGSLELIAREISGRKPALAVVSRSTPRESMN